MLWATQGGQVALHSNTATRHINFEQGTSRRRGGCTEKRQIKGEKRTYTTLEVPQEGTPKGMSELHGQVLLIILVLVRTDKSAC